MYSKEGSNMEKSNGSVWATYSMEASNTNNRNGSSMRYRNYECCSLAATARARQERNYN